MLKFALCGLRLIQSNAVASSPFVLICTVVVDNVAVYIYIAIAAYAYNIYRVMQ